MHIVVVGLSHRTAPVEVREQLSIPDSSIEDSLVSLKNSSEILEVSIDESGILNLSRTSTGAVR